MSADALGWYQVGAALGFALGLFVMRLYDNLWEVLHRVPECTPGACYCRLGCACMTMEAPK